MIYKTLKKLTNKNKEYDICIIGAGPAGITLSRELSRNFSVLLVEAGEKNFSKKYQNLYKDLLHPNTNHPEAHRYRFRQLGGSSTKWGGRCTPFDEHDFYSMNGYRNDSWHIKYDEISKYYDKACSILDCGDSNFIAHDNESKLFNFQNNDYFTFDSVEKYSAPTNFWKKYKKELKNNNNLDILIGHSLTKLNIKNNKLLSVTVSNINKNKGNIYAKKFIFCMGGFEITKILANTPFNDRFLGNESGYLGLNYMTHIAGIAGKLYPLDKISDGYGTDKNKKYFRRRIKTTRMFQNKYKVGNFIARIHFPSVHDPEHNNSSLSFLYLVRKLIGYEYGLRMDSKNQNSLKHYARHIKNIILDIGGLIKTVWSLFIYRLLASYKQPPLMNLDCEYYSLDFHAEQLPNSKSKIALSKEKDFFDNYKIIIDWQFCNEDLKTVKVSINALKFFLEKNKIAKLIISDDEIENEINRYGAYGGHHIGMTRIGSSKTGVVDTNLKLHDLENLYICSSSVFPTSSQANPTLTIVAIALRLSEHINDEF